MTQDVSNLSGVAVLGPRTDVATLANLSAVAVLAPPPDPEDAFAFLVNLSAVVVLGSPAPVAPVTTPRIGSGSSERLRQKLARWRPPVRRFIRR